MVIQFGKKNIYTGVIEKLHHHPPKEYEARYILDVLDETPHLNSFQLRLFRWISEYYMCTIGEVLNAALPAGLKLSSESFIELNPDFDIYQSIHDFTPNEMLVLDALSNGKAMSYSDIAKILQIKTYQNVLKGLLKKEAIVIFEKVKERYIPKKEKYVQLEPEYLKVEGALEALMGQLERKPQQQDVLLSYMRHVPVFNNPSLNGTGLLRKKLFNDGISESSLKTLIKNHVFLEFELIVPRFGNTSEKSLSTFELTPAQEQAKKEILHQFEKQQTVLLHGITGSGKTEVYVELIRQVMEEGSQVLYLLPEIAITTQMVNRLHAIFGDDLGVYHSRYSDNERVEVWKGVLNHRFKIVLGVRSAVFLPFDNLGLVIVDEEHETSFKQFDPAPRYHARDVSQVLADAHNAKVLLGSATPSIESYFLARSGKFGLVELNERYGGTNLPKIEYADVRLARRRKALKNDFTAQLFEKIGEVISQDGQVIIFRNRRGYSPHLTCEECAWIPKCENCAVSLTYHMQRGVLQCHYCGYKQKVVHSCPACGSAKLRGIGFGTEKLEEDLKLFFPEAEIKRMDFDTTRRKYGYQEIISEFEKGDIDILVGTQMVTKGLDFDNVKLVGVMDADVMLHYPDFRAFERTYQTLTQVSGRAGRRDQEGLVVIQTSDTQQQLLDWVRKGDFESLYKYEIGERQKFRYPPFYRLTKIILRHQDKSIVDRAANQLNSLLKAGLGHSLVIDPHEPLVARIKNKFIMEILIKARRGEVKLKSLKDVLRSSKEEILLNKDFKQVQVIFDVDPY